MRYFALWISCSMTCCQFIHYRGWHWSLRWWRLISLKSKPQIIKKSNFQLAIISWSDISKILYCRQECESVRANIFQFCAFVVCIVLVLGYQFYLEYIKTDPLSGSRINKFKFKISIVSGWGNGSWLFRSISILTSVSLHEPNFGSLFFKFKIHFAWRQKSKNWQCIFPHSIHPFFQDNNINFNTI